MPTASYQDTSHGCPTLSRGPRIPDQGERERDEPPRPPVAFQQARIRRLRRMIEDLKDQRGQRVVRQRAEARRTLKAVEKSLTLAQQQAAAGVVDLRGLAQRKRDRRARKAHARGALADQVNITDPDSRLMTEGSGGGSVQGYNAQIAVTDDHLILGVHVSQDANDLHCWTPRP